MAKHVLIFFPRHTGTQHELRDEQGHMPEFSRLLKTADRLQRSTKWVIQRGILEQFWGANELLHGPVTRFSPYALLTFLSIC